MKKLFTKLFLLLFAFIGGGILAWAAIAAEETTTIYSWESPTGTVIETGGTIAYVNGDNSSIRLNAKGHTGPNVITLNGKKVNIDDTTPSANAGHMCITLNEELKADDKITITAYRWKNNDGTKASIYMRFETWAAFEGSEGALYWVNCCNDNNTDYDDDGNTPNSYTWTVPSEAAGSKTIDLTRNDSGTNLYITKIVITRINEGSSTYTEQKNSDGATCFTGNEKTDKSYNLTGAAIAFASDTWTYKPDANSHPGFSGYWSGTNNPTYSGNSAPTSGSALYLTPTASNALAVYTVINADKSVYVLEGNTKIDFWIGDTKYNSGSTLSAKTYDAIKFNVTSGKTYSVFCTGSRMGFFGFKAIDSINDTEDSGNTPDPGTDPDSGTDPEPDSDPDTQIVTIANKAPAFPGAEGYGRYTTGGRGGTIYHVTNLDDYCDNTDYSPDRKKDDAIEGSLRYGINKVSGPRTIVFDVAGTIALKAPLKIANGDISILGQTAPGDGITLKNYTLGINDSNVIIRYIRCRMGDEGKRYWKNGEALTGNDQYVEDDAMNSYHKDSYEIDNVLIDHCSISWSVDECGSFYGNRYFTLQWCILSESLRVSHHEKGSHGYGGIWGGEKASFHHNLIADHDSRNPRFDHGYVSTLTGPVDYINNVVYNWGDNSTYGGENKPGMNPKLFNMIGNYYKAGPYTPSKSTTRLLNPTTVCKNCDGSNGTNVVPGNFYLKGNYMNGQEITSYTTANFAFDSNYNINSFVNNLLLPSQARPKGDDTFAQSNYTTLHAAPSAYNKLLDYVGASHARDAVDIRVINDMKNGTYIKGSNGSDKGLIDSPSDVGGWPELAAGTPITDTDRDGMPDSWETLYGLNPNDASDANTYTLDSKRWYTNIEVYANNLVEADIKAQNANAQTALDEYYPVLGENVEEPANTITGSETTPVQKASGVDIEGLCYTIDKTYNGGQGNNNKAFKLRTKSEGFAISVNKGYTITAFTLTGNDNYDTNGITVNGVYADGSTTNLLTNAVTFPADKSQNQFTINGISAKNQILITFASPFDSQLNTTIDFSYEYEIQPLELKESAMTSGRNGCITLKFNNPMMASDAKASLGEKTLAAEAEGTTVKFLYGDLDYGQSYTFSLPAGSLQDKYGQPYNEAIELSLTIDNRTTVTKARYDAVVSTAQELAEAIHTANTRPDKNRRFIIFCLPGTYKLPTLAEYQSGTGITTKTVEVTPKNEPTKQITFDNPTTYLEANNISIVGENYRTTIITNTVPTDEYNGQFGIANIAEGIGNGDVLQINKNVENTYLQGVTIRTSMGDGKGRDIALNDQGNKTILKEASLWGYQDTYVSNNSNSRFYIEGGLLRGRTDYLCGKGDVWYEQVTLQQCGNGGYLAVPSVPMKYGYIFNNCYIKNETNDVTYYLGRPWGQGTPIALFINTRVDSAPIVAGWAEMSNGWPDRFAEYNTRTTSGSIVDLSGRKQTYASSHSCNPVLTAEEAAYYGNRIRVMGGNDGWDPTEYTLQVAAPSSALISGNELSWSQDASALCYVVFKNGVYYGNYTESQCTIDDPSATWTIRAANACGGLGEAATAVLAPVTVSDIVEFIRTHGELVIQNMAEGLRATANRLDINQDGKLTISDVTKLIQQK